MEECIYFSEFNPTNAFICRLLLDPHNEYKLNYHIGNTLELDIKEKWNLDGFDLIIGNPPYNAPKTARETSNKKATGSVLYITFIKYTLSNLVPNGRLIFVVPRGWRRA